MPNSHTCSRNSIVELLYGGVNGAELKKLEQSSPKQTLILFEFIYNTVAMRVSMWPSATLPRYLIINANLSDMPWILVTAICNSILLLIAPTSRRRTTCNIHLPEWWHAFIAILPSLPDVVRKPCCPSLPPAGHPAITPAPRRTRSRPLNSGGPAASTN